MWKFLKDLFGSGVSPSMSAMEESIHKLANANALNRRKNARVNYPHIGPSGPFPRVLYKGTELNVSNVSVGGLLIIDDTAHFGQNVGEVFTLDFCWPDLSTKQKARLVGANMQKRHFQFVDFNAQAFVRISQLVKPGFTGQKFRCVKNETGALDAIEMWMGPAHESLVFLDQEILAEFSKDGIKTIFPANQPPRNPSNDKPIHELEILEFFILFSNISNPSNRVKRLVESLERWVRTSQSSQRTGTDG